jgi:cytochrome P450
MRRALTLGLLPTHYIPGPPPLSPLAGIIKKVNFERDSLRYLCDLQKQYGNLVALSGTRKRVIAAFGTEHHRLIQADQQRFEDRGLVLRGPWHSAQRRLSSALSKKSGDDGQRKRHLLAAAFEEANVDLFRNELIDLVDFFLRRWMPGEVRDMFEEMRQLSRAVAGKFLYGIGVNDAHASLLAEMDNWLQLNLSAYARLLQANLPFTPYHRMLRQAKTLEGRIINLIRAKEVAGDGGADVLSRLTRARKASIQSRPAEDLAGEVLALFPCSFETMAETLTWTLFLLAQHPCVYADVLDELHFLNGLVPTSEQLERLPLLDRVLAESARILPAVVVSRRIVTKDGDIGPYFLPRGTMILFGHYVTHHMPELYSEPERFQPERWAGGERTLAAYSPIAAGTALARRVLKSILVPLLTQWRPAVVANARIDRLVAVTLTPRYGMPMTLHRQDRQFGVQTVRGNIHEMVELPRGSGGTTSLGSWRQAA